MNGWRSCKLLYWKYVWKCVLAGLSESIWSGRLAKLLLHFVCSSVKKPSPYLLRRIVSGSASSSLAYFPDSFPLGKSNAEVPTITKRPVANLSKTHFSPAAISLFFRIQIHSSTFFPKLSIQAISIFKSRINFPFAQPRNRNYWVTDPKGQKIFWNVQ